MMSDGYPLLVKCRDTHIMLFKAPIMLCFDSQRQAYYAHHFVPIMLTIINSTLQALGLIRS